MRDRLNARLPEGSTIGIFGGGQLGRMTALAAAELGYRPHIFAPPGDAPACDVASASTRADYLDEDALNSFGASVDTVTSEFENVPAAVMDILAKHCPVSPGKAALEVAQHRIREKTLARDLGIKTPIKLIPHGVIVKNRKKKISALNKKKVALFFSRIHKKKGILELLNSWAEIKPENWILKIYGPVSDIKYLKEIKKKIELLSLRENVKLFEPVFDSEKKEQIFLNSDCFLLPSKSENFGMSIVEALSYGIPVLTTEGTPWSILSKINGGKVINFSQENLTISLKEILNMGDEELISMGSNGRNYLLKNFDMDNIIKDYIKFYHSIYGND